MLELTQVIVKVVVIVKAKQDPAFIVLVLLLVT